jgi:diguanylate cyclase (GGDEF)-like protein
MGNHQALEWVLRSLLRIRGLEETEHTVTDIIRAVVAAEWTALYVRENESYALRSNSPATRLGVRETFPADRVDSALGGKVGPIMVNGTDGLDGDGQDGRLLVPLSCGEDMPGFFMLGDCNAESGYGPGELTLIRRVAECCEVALQNAAMVETLRSQVSTDFLTGCFNRRAFDEYLRMEVTRGRRYGRPLSLLLLDVDHFKWVNDGLGHQVGDHVLKRLGAALREAFRSTDRICRYGGDEFAIVFPETHKEEAARLGERLRVQLRSTFPDHVLQRSITVSLGVAGYPEDGEEPEKVLNAADRALYRAKASGRNRMVAA